MTEEIMNTISGILEEQKIDIDTFVEATGTSRGYYSHLKSGRRDFNLDIFTKYILGLKTVVKSDVSKEIDNMVNYFFDETVKEAIREQYKKSFKSSIETVPELDIVSVEQDLLDYLKQEKISSNEIDKICGVAVKILTSLKEKI